MNQDNEVTGANEGKDSQASSQSASDASPHEGKGPIPTDRPSQAEGDRETIEADIAEKEGKGEL